MRPKRFTKRYETTQECEAARFHHQWLSAYARPLPYRACCWWDHVICSLSM
ncbi:MAG: hypothetical protein JWM17_1409 [Actinobacteria bacterium]|nr:hypothetical protein [Actinomycetota bacterium]